MGTVLRLQRRPFAFVFISFCITVGLLGSFFYTHLPRTCIPSVDPQYSWKTTTSTISQHQQQQQTSSSPSSSSLSPPPPRIVMLSGEICTSTNPESKCRILGHLSYYNRREYIDHHQGRYTLQDNFTTHFESVLSLPGKVTPAWAKILILKQELDRNENDWIFWIDTDALITKMDIRLEEFIDTRYSMVVTKDDNWLNAGVFLLRVNDWSRRFMDQVLEKMGPGSNEQDWMIKLLEDQEQFEEKKEVKYLPQCSFNSYWKVNTFYGVYRPGDFVMHWAGHNFDPLSFKDWQSKSPLKLFF